MTTFPLVGYHARPRKNPGEILMLKRLKLPLVVPFALFFCLFWTQKTVTAAPQAAAPAKPTRPAPSGIGIDSIPDTTIAINSTTPMSQRIVHYEIEAKYDASTHTVDANEVIVSSRIPVSKIRSAPCLTCSPAKP